MLGVSQPQEVFGAPPVAANVREAKTPVRTLVRHECLFRAGDIKTNLYRVETGVLDISAPRADLSLELIEFAVAGDIVGMGFAKIHAMTARAAVETKVSCFPLDASDRLLTDNERATSRFADAVEREFAFTRHTLVEAGRGQPATRLASFLVAVSRRNAIEGGDPTLIDDSLNCAVIAEHLGLRLDVLALTLVQLETKGLVRPALGRGLRLMDLGGLEALADVSGGSPLPDDPYEEGPQAPVATDAAVDDGTTRDVPLCYARHETAELNRRDADPQNSTSMVYITAVTFAVGVALAYGGWAL